MTVRGTTEGRRLDDDAARERVIGRVEGRGPGPLVVVVAGLHGNEPAGIPALRRVLATLGEHDLPLRGRLVALVGNRAALGQGRRYLAHDLNRMWTPEWIARLRRQDPGLDQPEEREMRELLEVLEFEISLAPGPVVLLDLHSTSAPGCPFAVLGDTPAARRLKRHLPLPGILGLEERIDGPLLSWMADQGHTAIVVEGGQNEDPRTAEHHEAAIWLVLAGSGALDPDATPHVLRSYDLLKDVSRGTPAMVEVLEGHAIEPGDGFRMRPGYVNFQPVRTGEALAEDYRGSIRAAFDGHILMPLYQGQGEDGFFLGREIPRWRLTLSAWLARTGHWALAGSLPGLRPHPHDPCALIVEGELSPVVLFWLRLCGFRRWRLDSEGRTVVVRRP